MKTFVSWFEEAKKIYGFCPCCGEMFRLSDLHIFTKTPPLQTPFERIANQLYGLERQKVRFEEKEEEIREQAKAKGQREARRQLRKISPYFFGEIINLREVKLLFDPVEYIVFKGLANEKCSSVQFVDHPADTRERELIHSSLESALRLGRVEWQTFRVENSGRITLDESYRPRKSGFATARQEKPMTLIPVRNPGRVSRAAALPK